jgi:DNA modification methylase
MKELCMNSNLPLNTVLNGDVFDLLRRLPDHSVDVVYGDPDYNVGVRYNDKSYTRSFDEYIEWYGALAQEAMRVLKPTGNLFMINYPRQNAYLRVKYLEAISHEVHEYVWVYNTNVGHSKKKFTTAHRSILHATKTADNNFYKDNVAVEYQNPNDRRIRQRIAEGSTGRMPYSWFYFDLVKNVSRQKTLHACQIPEKLSEMLILAASQPQDVVVVLFGGSGSEIAVCQRHHRHFIAAEIDPEYYAIILERITQQGEIPSKYRLMPNGSHKSGPVNGRKSIPDEDGQMRLIKEPKKARKHA